MIVKGAIAELLNHVSSKRIDRCYAGKGHCALFKFSGIGRGMFIFLIALLLFLISNKVFSQAASATWALTTDETSVVAGNVSAGSQTFGSGVYSQQYHGTEGVNSRGWDSVAINANDYYAFTVSPTTGNSVTIGSVSFDHLISNQSMTAALYYSLDGFVTSSQIGSNVSVSSSGSTASFSGLSISVPDGSTITFRIYGWGSGNANRRFYVKNVVVSDDSNGNGSYCPFSFNYVDQITNVTFSNINNTSSASSVDDYEDFTSVAPGIVSKGSTYQLSVQGNTNGDFRNYVSAFFDWNQDGDFDDSNEYYEIGRIRNSTGVDGKTASADITIPAAATFGVTRMRIIFTWDSYNTDPCFANGGWAWGYFGQVEDYHIDISSTLPEVNFTSSAQSSIDESGTLTITARLSATSASDVSIPFTLSGTATPGVGNDYTITTSPIVITAGDLEEVITIAIFQDTNVEGNETVIVTMGVPTGANLGSTFVHTATITDDDFVANVDTDGDGIADISDLDDDNDGIPDFIEGGLTCTDFTIIQGGTSGEIYEIDLSTSTPTITTLTNSPFLSGGINAVAVNADDNVIYYGSGDVVYGYNGTSHFIVGDLGTSITPSYPNANLNGAGACYFDGYLYLGTEDGSGDWTNLLKIELSAGGVSFTGNVTRYPPVNTSGGFGDLVVAANEGVGGLIYGSTTGEELWAFDLVNETYSVLYDNGGTNQITYDLYGRLWIADYNTQVMQRINQVSFATYGPVINLSDNPVDLGINYNCPQPDLTLDSDGDGYPDHLDLDSDNDGIFDVYEAGGTDLDEDGIIDGFVDADNDGLSDNVDDLNGGSGGSEVTNGTALPNIDSDGDGRHDRIELDSDGDGCFDVVEAGFNGNGSGQLSGTGINTNGLVIGGDDYSTPINDSYQNYGNAAQIISDPVNSTICENENTSFTVVTSDADSFRWEYRVNSSSSWQEILGADIYSNENTATLSLTNVTMAYDGYEYQVTVFNRLNNCVILTSNFASLTVNSGTTPAMPGAITGIQSQCAGETNQIYSISPVMDATSYTWSVPAGWTITAGQGTTSISVTTGSVGQNGDITVSASNICGASANQTLPVTVSNTVTAPTSATSNRNDFCADDPGSITLTASGGSGGTLNWYTGSCGGTLVGSGTSLVLPSPTATTTYYARWESGCGISSCLSATVNVNPVLDVEVSISANPNLPICENESVVFTANPINGGSSPSYQWKLNGNNVGTDSPTYTPASISDGDDVSVVLISSEACTNSQVTVPVTRFSWDDDTKDVKDSDFGFDAIQITGGQIIAGGLSGTTCLAPITTPKTDIEMVFDGNEPEFSSDGIDYSIYYRRDESQSEMFTRGNSLIITGGANYSVTYRVDDGAGGYTQVSSGNVQAIPQDGQFHYYRFVYDPTDGYGRLFYDGAELWTSPTATVGQSMYWTGTGNVMVGRVTDASGRLTPTYDNLELNSIFTNSAGDTLTVNINPLPTPGLTSSDADNIICQGESVTFTGSGGTNYEFFVDGSSVQGPSNNALFTSTGLIDGQEVTVEVTDGNGCSDVSTGIVTTVSVCNIAPTAINDTAITNTNGDVDIDVTANDTDPQGNGTIDVSTVDLDTITAGIQSSFTNIDGAWTVETSTGVVTFDPEETLCGSAQIGYSVNDNAATPLTSNNALITVFVNDTEFPNISFSEDTIIHVVENGPTATVNVALPNVVDNCGANATNRYNSNTDATDDYPVNDSTWVVWDAVDGAANTTIDSQLVIVAAYGPLGIICPDDSTLEGCNPSVPEAGTPQYNTVFPWVLVNTSNDHPGTVSGGPCNYTRTIKYYAEWKVLGLFFSHKDSCEQVFSYTVDTIPPSLSCIGDVDRSMDGGACTYTVQGTEFDLQSVSDVCSSIPTVWNNINGGNSLSNEELGFGINTIKWYAEDDCGNIDSCSFVVDVNDNQPVTVEYCPNDTLVCDTIIDPFDPIFSDNCSVDLVSWDMTGATVASSPSLGINTVGSYDFNEGTTTISYLAMDVEGNQTYSCSFDVSAYPNPVIDDLADVYSCGTYTLPIITGKHLTGNVGYFTGSMGTGTPLAEGDEINSDIIVYIYDTNNGCWDEDTVNIQVNQLNVYVTDVTGSDFPNTSDGGDNNSGDHCPDLTQPIFEPNDTIYDPGATIVQFRVNRENSTFDWLFDFELGGTDVNVLDLTLSGNGSGDPTYTGPMDDATLDEYDGSFVLFTYLIANIPGAQLEVSFTVSGAADENCSESGETGDNIKTHKMSIMPLVGSFN